MNQYLHSSEKHFNTSEVKKKTKLFINFWNLEHNGKQLLNNYGTNLDILFLQCTDALDDL